MAKDKRTAGAPRDLNVKNCSAGFSIGESCRNKNVKHFLVSISDFVEEPLLVLILLTDWIPMKFNRGFAPAIRTMAWTRPRMLPIAKADEADGIFLLLCSGFPISKVLP